MTLEEIWDTCRNFAEFYLDNWESSHLYRRWEESSDLELNMYRVRLIEGDRYIDHIILPSTVLEAWDPLGMMHAELDAAIKEFEKSS